MLQIVIKLITRETCILLLNSITTASPPELLKSLYYIVIPLSLLTDIDWYQLCLNYNKLNMINEAFLNTIVTLNGKHLRLR